MHAPSASAPERYPSFKAAVHGSEMVIASQPLAAQAGLDILACGGNAVDAAIAAAAAIAVVEPTNNSIGGDAFAQVFAGGKLHGLNASGRAPLGIDVVRLARLPAMPQRGWDSVTVPGAVSAWTALVTRFGRLDFATVLEPAIRYARAGFHVSPSVAQKWREQVPKLRSQPGFEAAFLPGGAAPVAGALFLQPTLAQTLERVARTNGKDFYTGETARRIAAFARETGGALSAEDLRLHVPEWVDAIQAPYGALQVSELPPNGQGAVALFALGVLAHHDVARFPADSAASLHLQIEAIKLAFAEIGPLIGDTDCALAQVRHRLQAPCLQAAAARIHMRQASDFGHTFGPLAGTVYLAAGDRDGMMVSLIQSNYMGFGSGIVVPDAGVSLQNRGACFSTDAGSPSFLRPGKRPFHTILPGFAFAGGGEPIAFGATGGTFQPQGHVQMMVRLYDYAQSPQAIVDAPRFKVGPGRQVVLEPGFPADTVSGLAALGHDVVARTESTWDFGGMQILLRKHGSYVGASDSRRDSHIAVR
ncbi:gamma-glutamyltransferase family protein [Cupriavidus sp. D39]|uniref:gamma-glutamyltransferase family protein n=1 Tax=Cupriavidus sp. D39 TaxID=2997877 RepID=UPI002D1E40CA|nr:gamma-glutamyltransferase family protein [Cupriavidus sp. D39]